MIRKLICTLTICLSLGCAWAQDPNFSQYWASPLTLNPALTGKFDGLYRVAGNYRNQWPSINNAYTTYTTSFDAGILKDRIPEFDQFGVGVLGFADDAGNGILKDNAFALSVAYQKSLDEDGNYQLGVGFQGTYANKRLDVSKVTFEDQLTSSGFTGTTSEIFPSQSVNVSYFDMNAGVLCNGSTDSYNNFYLGASMYHINQPKESFQGDQFFKLSRRYTFQAGGKLRTDEYNYFHFSANYSKQGDATDFSIGGAFALNVNSSEDDPTNLYLGSWYRFGDAIIPYVGLEFGDIQIGLTYDVNVSTLKPGSNLRGGTEISLIYIRKPATHTAIKCPKF